MLMPMALPLLEERHRKNPVNYGSVVPGSFPASSHVIQPIEHSYWPFPTLQTVPPLQPNQFSCFRAPMVVRGPVLAIAKAALSPTKNGVLQAVNTSMCVPPPMSNPSQGLEKSLGYGAFGVVWLVVDPRTGEQVALKRIPSVLESTTSAKRAYRELKLLFSLEHSNIVKLVDVVKVNSYSSFSEVSILCEFMHTDLHKIIVSSQYLSLEHVKLFIYQILRGLKYLHSAGVIHRDLKPGNLLVNADCLLKICDFGLARSVPFFDAEVTRNPLTLEVVTQFYRSPELLLGSNFYTAAIDQWSVGCILGELLSRRILFQSSNPFRQLDMIFDLLGSPNPVELIDLLGCPSSSVEFVLNCPVRPPNHMAILNLLVPNNLQLLPNPVETPDPDLVALFTGLLSFSPSKRLTADQALTSPFLAGGRVRFHSCMCDCCPPRSRIPVITNTFTPVSPLGLGWHETNAYPLFAGRHPVAMGSAGTMSSSPSTPPSPFHSSRIPVPQFTTITIPPLISPQLMIASELIMPAQHVNLEPIYQSGNQFNYLNTEIDVHRLSEAKHVLWNLIQDYFRRDRHRTRVVINNFSPNFQSFINSSVAFV